MQNIPEIRKLMRPRHCISPHMNCVGIRIGAERGEYPWALPIVKPRKRSFKFFKTFSQLAVS